MQASPEVLSDVTRGTSCSLTDAIAWPCSGVWACTGPCCIHSSAVPAGGQAEGGAPTGTAADQHADSNRGRRWRTRAAAYGCAACCAGDAGAALAPGDHGRQCLPQVCNPSRAAPSIHVWDHAALHPSRHAALEMQVLRAWKDAVADIASLRYACPFLEVHKYSVRRT